MKREYITPVSKVYNVRHQAILAGSPNFGQGDADKNTECLSRGNGSVFGASDEAGGDDDLWSQEYR